MAATRTIELRTAIPGPRSQEILERTHAIGTQRNLRLPEHEPASRPETVTLEAVPLVDELEGHRFRIVPASVKVQITMQPRQKVYEITDVPVQFLCPANFALKPLFRDERAGKITLRVVGPFGEESPSVIAFVDLGARKWEPGLYEEPLKLQLPKGFQLAQTSPRLVAFQLVPIEQGMKASGTRGL